MADAIIQAVFMSESDSFRSNMNLPNDVIIYRTEKFEGDGLKKHLKLDSLIKLILLDLNLIHC